MSLPIAPGTTGVRKKFRLLDDAGLAVDSKAAATLPDIYYNRTGEASVKITLVDLSAATDAWTPGGVWFLGRGEYQIDIPDAAFATATVEVTLSGEATGLHVICEPMAVAYVPADMQTIKTQAVTCAAGVTVNANVGTTQPVGFTGTGASALVKGDAVDLGGTAAASATVGALSSAGVTAVQSGLATSAGQTTILGRLGTPAGASIAADIATNLAKWTTAITESYAADGSAPTPEQALMMIMQSLHEFAISGTTRTVKKLDGSATAMTFTLDDATNPTSTTRAS